MNVAIIGCGYVFDHYMSTWKRHPSLILKGVSDINSQRAATVAEQYGLKIYASNEEIYADPEIDIVANFTSIESHYEVTKSALLSGKHVYSEKPLTKDLDEARELMDLAKSRGLHLSCAPSNALSDTMQTMWRAVLDGAVGDVRLVYAEFDDNPIYLMHPEHWQSRTGAPWPYIHEYEQGCTVEHIGYHLTWLCSIFGPVKTVTPFSAVSAPDKTDLPMHPPDTPDFSVACLVFESGVIARVTCSIAAPLDHRIRIVGNKGMLTADTYRHYRCPVYLERFSQLTLNARKAYSVRQNSILQWIFGVGGRRLRLLRNPPPGSKTAPSTFPSPWWSPKALMNAFKKRELGAQDKTIGIAELADAIRTGRQPFPSADFTLHLTELTMAVQNAGPNAGTIELSTRFEPVSPQPATRAQAGRYAAAKQPSFVTRRIDRLLTDLHKH